MHTITRNGHTQSHAYIYFEQAKLFQGLSFFHKAFKCNLYERAKSQTLLLHHFDNKILTFNELHNKLSKN